MPSDLFRTDPVIFESRRTAWLIRTHLLLEWNRPAEALAWTCLECQLSTESRDARALRDRLLRQLNLDFDPPETPDNIAVETQWPGVAGMYEFKAKLERDVILSLRFPEEARRYGVPLPNGILLYGPPGCGKTFIARKIAEKLAFNFLELAQQHPPCGVARSHHRHPRGDPSPRRVDQHNQRDGAQRFHLSLLTLHGGRM